MTIELLQRYWAPAIAALLAIVVLTFVVLRVFRDSPRGRLRAQVRELRSRYRQLVGQARAVSRAEQRLQRLSARADRVRPRQLEEAREAVADARALQKIAQDQVLIAENHVRKLIFEEFPPRRHEALRGRFLARPKPDGKPFTF